MISAVTTRTRSVFRCAWTLAAALALLPSARAEVLTLEDCLRETAAHNPTIISQQLDVERATGTRLVLRARALPTLNITGTLGYQGAETSEVQRVTSRQGNGNVQTTIVTTQRPSQAILLGTGGLTQTIFDAAIPASWRRGSIGVLAAQEAYYTVAVSQLYQARTQFNRALFEQQRGEVLRATNEVLAANVRAVEALVSAGVKGRQDLLIAQVQRANFDPSVVEAAGTYRSTLATLLQTMGRQPGTGPGGGDPITRITLRGELDESTFSFDAEAVGKEALAHRSDVLSLRVQAQALKEDARITRGAYYPRVQLYLAGELLPEGFVRSSRPNAIRSTDQVQTTEIRPGAREDWTVIDTGAIRGESRRQDAVRAEIEVGLQRLERNIPGELAGVRATVDRSAATVRAFRGNVDIAQNTLNIINAGVAQGINSQIEFLDAQTGVLTTRLGILDAALALTQGRTEFDRITGRYLRFVTDDVPAPASSTRSSR